MLLLVYVAQESHVFFVADCMYLCYCCYFYAVERFSAESGKNVSQSRDVAYSELYTRS